MKVLGIETATIICGAAIAVDGTVTGEAEVQARNVHAENIMRLIEASARQAGVRTSELDAVAVSIGPGSFTGLRIGLSVAKGLCFALTKPLVAVPTLQALAERAVRANLVTTQYLLAALDARRDEVYCQLFRVTTKGIHPEWQERDLAIHALREVTEGKDLTISGDAAAKLKTSGHFPGARYVPGPYARCSATAVALAGNAKALAGTFADARTVEPMYLKEFYLPTN